MIHLAASVFACVQATVSYMNEWDRVIPRLDVVDDYASERAEVLAAQGPCFAFSRGDYCAKLLLGSIDPEIDALDERPPPRSIERAAVKRKRHSGSSTSSDASRDAHHEGECTCM